MGFRPIFGQKNWPGKCPHSHILGRLLEVDASGTGFKRGRGRPSSQRRQAANPHLCENPSAFVLSALQGGAASSSSSPRPAATAAPWRPRGRRWRTRSGLLAHAHLWRGEGGKGWQPGKKPLPKMFGRPSSGILMVPRIKVVPIFYPYCCPYFVFAVVSDYISATHPHQHAHLHKLFPYKVC